MSHEDYYVKDDFSLVEKFDKDNVVVAKLEDLINWVRIYFSELKSKCWFQICTDCF